MTDGSLQLRQYRAARCDVKSMLTAAIEAGIGIGEARLIEADELRAALAEGRAAFASPPQPDPIPTPEPGAQSKEDDMARGKKNTGTINGEVPKPDFELADKIYSEEIAPANTAQKRAMKDASDAWKSVKKDAHVHVGAARAAYGICKLEDAEQQAYLRTMHGVFAKRGVMLRPDMVDVAEGKDQPRSIIPIGEGRRPQLATIPPAVEGDADLADGADDQQHAAE